MGVCSVFIWIVGLGLFCVYLDCLDEGCSVRVYLDCLVGVCSVLSVYIWIV